MSGLCAGGARPTCSKRSPINMKVKIYTTGCRTNQAESEAMAVELAKRGFRIVTQGAADIHILNACTVTAKAERHARNVIYRAKAENPGAFVVLTGCLATRLQLFPVPEFFRKDGPDLVIGNRGKNGLADIIAQRFAGHAQETKIGQARNRRVLKVQDGCSRNCAYCIVPLVRGRSRSITLDSVLADAREIEAAGASEIMLTGTHLGMYGRDLRPRMDLADLIHRMLEETGKPLLRVSSVEPEETSMRLLDVFRAPRVAHHLHLPLQSGSNDVLRQMNRPYTKAVFQEIVDAARNIAPDIAIGLDVIVGFPTETTEAFQETVDLVKAINPMYLHVFRYSPRPGTPAERLKDPVPYQVKHRRSKILTQMSQDLRRAFIDRLTGKQVRTVFVKPRQDGIQEGLGDNYVKVLYRGTGKTIVNVRVDARDKDYAIGVEV